VRDGTSKRAKMEKFLTEFMILSTGNFSSLETTH